MNVQTAIEKRRTIRKYQNTPVPETTLLRLVELARLHASGGNMQPLRYAVISKKPMTDTVFDMLKWAMYLPEYDNRDHRPPAYIVILRDNNVKTSCQFDVGAASTTIMLAAVEAGLDTCCLGSMNRSALTEALKLPENLVPELVISVGYPAESSRAVPMGDSVRYYQEEDGNLCVPKLSLEEVLVRSDI